MKVTLKPLKGSTFEVEVDPEQKVEELKKLVAAAAAEFPADQQKLIYSGRILKDDEPVKDIGIKDGQFVVVMAAKAKPPAASTASAAATPAQPAAAAPAPAATPAAAPAPAAAPNATEQAAANVVSGTAAEATISQLCEMGFGRPEVERCLQAAFGNPDRAVEYLMNGIPEGVLGPAGGAPPPAAAGGAPAAAPAAGGRNSAFPAMTGTGGGAGGGAAGNLPPILQNLRNSPQFTQYAQMVAENPQALQQLLAVIAQTNPEVVQAIQENQEAFMQMVQEAATGGGAANATDDPVAAMLAAGGGGGQAGGPDAAEAAQMQQMAGMLAQNPAMLQQLLPQIEATNPELAAAIRANPQALMEMLQEAGAGGGGMGGMPPGGPGPTVIQLTEEENAAVGRLVALGFDRQTAAQAYLACDKNEEIAANFLFENGDADMD